MQKIAAIQMNSVADTELNLIMAEQLINEAVLQDAGLVVLPEMVIGCGIEQTLRLQIAEPFGDGPIQARFSQIANTLNVWLVVGSIPLKANDPRKIRSACLVYDNKGSLVARYDKIHLFDANVRNGAECYIESACVEPGDTITVIDTPFGRLGLAICYDMRFPELFRNFFRQGVEIIALPSAFTVPTGEAHWETLLRARAIENFSYVIGAGQWGQHANGRHTYGNSMIVDPWGKIVAHLVDECGVICHTLDKDYLQQIRRDFPVYSHQKIFNISQA
jgi:predicted amidohydrolase